MHPASNNKRNGLTALFFGGVAFSMLGAAYAAVPLYQIFCQVTGFGGTTQRSQTVAETIIERTINIRFDANTNGIDWHFQPVQRQANLRIGEEALAFYRARNTGSDKLTGTATFNVTPAKAGLYFNKIECFCFSEQTLEPGQTVDMPVSYYIDPEIAKDEDLRSLKTITLSYTFFPIDEPARKTSDAAAALKTRGTDNPLLRQN